MSFPSFLSYYEDFKQVLRKFSTYLCISYYSFNIDDTFFEQEITLLTI
ncbi:hypothetical protein OZD61_04260 [Wolbachia endosymbiont of Drosophila bocki]|nr:hypothetical protein [Wolbachia endosymbiont of Drosophila bocki]